VLAVQLKDDELHLLVVEFCQSLFVPIQRFDLNEHDDHIFPLVVVIVLVLIGDADEEYYVDYKIFDDILEIFSFMVIIDLILFKFQP
jgi:hypothetical protein